jgi:hypothetical protein
LLAVSTFSGGRFSERDFASGFLCECRPGTPRWPNAPKRSESIIDIANANDVNYRSYSAASMIRLKAEIEAIDHAIGDEEKPAPADSASMIA